MCVCVCGVLHAAYVWWMSRAFVVTRANWWPVAAIQAVAYRHTACSESEKETKNGDSGGHDTSVASIELYS